MRKTIIAGNWKMNGTRAEAEALLKELLPLLDPTDNTTIVICPPFTALTTVQTVTEGTEIELGAQDVFWKDKGSLHPPVSPRKC